MASDQDECEALEARLLSWGATLRDARHIEAHGKHATEYTVTEWTWEELTVEVRPYRVIVWGETGCYRLRCDVGKAKRVTRATLVQVADALRAVAPFAARGLPNG